jgi:multidrug efflux pump subunit AcrB
MDANECPRGPIALMARHPVAPNLAMVICLVGGLLVWNIIKREVFPETQEDLVEISVAYPGASPEEVEQGIVLAIEEAVRGLDGVKEVSSTAIDGQGTVTIEATSTEGLARLAQDAQGEVDRIRTFPLEAEEPEITVVSRRIEVARLQLHGDVDEIVLRECAEEFRAALLQHPGITQVDLNGAKPMEISIEVPQENLRRYNLTLQDIAERLNAAAVELPGGSVKPQSGEVLVRVKERRDYGRQFAQLPMISNVAGAQVLLKDIATITDGFEEVDTYSWFDGSPSIGVEVYRVGDQTPVNVSAAMHEVIEDFTPRLPENVQISEESNMADVYQQRLDLLLRNGFVGICLVFIVLTLFLELRLAFWVMMGIPVSFLGGVFFLPMFDVSINMMSLFGFLVALGIVVDDAIVVGENIYYHHQQGKDLTDASIDGAREMAVPVTFSVLTNVVTFLPIIFIPGTMGKLFWMMPVVVICAFMVSLFESLFVLPAHLAHARKRPPRGLNRIFHQMQQWFARTFTQGVHVIYRPLLTQVLHHRYLTMACAFAIFVLAVAWPVSGRMGLSMMAAIESDSAVAQLELPFGSAVERTTEVARHVEAGARRVVEECGRPELVEGISVLVGSGGSHSASIRVSLADAEVRDTIMSTEEFVRRWREAVGPVYGIDTLTYSSDFGGPGGGADVTVELRHRDIAVLEKASEDLAARLAKYPMVKDINDGFQPGKDQIDFKMTPEGKSMGLTARSVANQVRSAFYGAEAVRQQRGRNELKVMVRRPKNERISEYDIESLMLRTPSGLEVPLRDVVETVRGDSYTSIDRRQGSRVVQVEADVEPRRRNEEVISALEETELPELLSAYPGLTTSFEGHQAEIRDSMGSLKAGFIIALLAIYGLLALPFRSYVQPLIIMVSIPFGIVGAILGHLIMGYDLSLDSLFGVVALSGVVVNDALVLVDATNRRCRAGVDTFTALLNAGEQRFRPVMLTTLTTFCGVAPLIFERSIQAQIMIPMAISLGFGIVFATIITLVIVPCLYYALEDIKNVVAALGRFIRGEFDVKEPQQVSSP